MAKKRIQEHNFIFSKDHVDKNVAYKTGMPIIKCVCGFEILLIPDLKAMNRAIKTHISEHKKADYVLVSDSLEEFLDEQILTVASKMSLLKVS